MFKRKLVALDYTKDFNPENETQFRQMVVWLEDMKVRLYPIEERQNLRNINDSNWEETLRKYLKDLVYPYDDESIKDRVVLSDWLIGSAVRFEYGDKVNEYKPVIANGQGNASESNGTGSTDNPLEKLNFHGEDFKMGIRKISELLKIPAKANDPTAVLRAVSKVVTAKLSKEAIERSQIKEQGSGVDFTVSQIPLGFDTGDEIINEASKVLRLLYIQDLRSLQTRINETIVSVQSLVADPRTDSKLGKIGW